MTSAENVRELCSTNIRDIKVCVINSTFLFQYHSFERLHYITNQNINVVVTYLSHVYSWHFK